MVETQIIVNLAAVECPSCGMLFWLDKKYKEHREHDHETIYCPNGHSLYFPAETEEERLHKLVLQKTKDLREAMEQRDNYEKELTRVTKRIKAGVCPQCHRHFTNLERHMKTRHS